MPIARRSLTNVCICDTIYVVNTDGAIMKPHFELYILTFENDNLMIAAYSAKKPESLDFSSTFCVDDGDISFVKERIKLHSDNLILLDVGGHAAFVLPSLFYSSRLLLCAVTDISTDFAASFADVVGNIDKSRSVVVNKTFKRMSSKRSAELFELTELLGSLLPKNTLLPSSCSYSLFLTLDEISRAASELIGCGVKTENDGSFTEIENYDISFFAAFILCAAAYVKRAGTERQGTVSFRVENGKLLAKLNAETLPNMKPFEFNALQKLADEAEMYFCTFFENGIFVAELAAQRPDISKIGLKDETALN